MSRFTLCVVTLLCPGIVSAAEPTPLKLLFLGDNGHHRPQERYLQLEPVLRGHGIEMKYADDPAAALNVEALKAFDGLILYANIDQIAPEQDKALQDFVAGGKGFIPLHCASFCFRNSPAFVELVGAQFQRHGGEVFSVENALPEHPIMRGYGGFSSWDETYIHTKHNPKDRTVLEYRVQGGQAAGQEKEPWTWVRTHGKGRVFYTAWGHDQRTFGNPGFQNLVERGIRWACGQDPSVAGGTEDSGRLRSRLAFAPLPMTAIPKDLPKFEYVDVGPKIPNYQPGRGQGGPRSQMQQPVSPAESMKHYSVPEGFELQIFASEENFAGKPIAMTWDERGRLWTCETVDYPNELQRTGEGRDRIRISEDTNGDGKADKFTVFAEQLSIPTAIAFHRGGIIVQNGVETLYLKDTNGDDQADIRETLITGWQLGDTHGGVSNFQYGLDNWIWAMQGYNDSRPKFGDGQEATAFRMGFFRFNVEQKNPGMAIPGLPKVSAVEFLRSTDNNTWGLGISEEGLVFGSTANHNPSVYMPIPNRYYERVRGWAPEQLRMIADTHLFKAITDKVRQVDQFGGYTAGAGHALYTARNYPESFWNRTAFVCEPTGHLVGTFTLQANGSDFSSTSPMNLVASDDEWAAPIMAEVGPDGNVWVLDWYNFIVQHNPTPQGFRTGKGNAYESDLRDKKHGRVYRLVYNGNDPVVAAVTGNVSLNGLPVKQGATIKAGTYQVTVAAGETFVNITAKEHGSETPLSIERPQELVAALKRDNLFWRRHAQRLLVERGQVDVVPELLKLVADQSTDTIGLNVGAIHALWTLYGLGVINFDEHRDAFKAVGTALSHPSAGVRRNAVQVLERTHYSLPALQRLVDDADPQVALAAWLVMSEIEPMGSSAAIAASASLRSRTTMSDRWLADAVTIVAAVNGIEYIEILSQIVAIPGEPQPDRSNPAWNVVRRVTEHIARGKPSDAETSRLATAIVAQPLLLDASLDGLSRGWPKGYAVKISPAAEEQLVAAFQTAPGSTKGQLARLAGVWGSTAFDKYSSTIIATLLKTVKDRMGKDEDRLSAAAELVAYQSLSETVVTDLLSMLTPQTPADFGSRLVATLGESQASNVGSAIVDGTRSMTPTVRQAALRVLLSRPQTTEVFLTAVEQGQLQLADLSLDQKQALANHPDQQLRRRAAKLLSATGGLPNPDRQKVLDELHAVVDITGDPAAGKELFKKQCAKCHTHSGEGQRIGPDLTGMAVYPKHELLIHILDPSRSVEGNFRVYTVALNDGKVLTGMLAAESKTAIEIIDTEAKRHAIPREDIDELVGSTKSLMPEGFEKQVKPAEIADLLEFLTQRGKYVPLDLRKVATAVSTKGMFISETADVERLIFADWSPKTFEGIPFHLVDPQGDRVPNAVLLYSASGTLPRKMPRSVTLPCNMPARAIHLLSGVGGWAYPFDQKQTVSMIVRLKYADGQTEDHELKNGVHFADYIQVVNVPESKLAFRLRGQQIRYLSVVPKSDAKIDTIDLVKGPDNTAPVVMAVTVESR